MRRLSLPLARGLAAAAATLCMAAQAGPIGFDTFGQFAFEGVGSEATGCDPADPAGPLCIPSSGTSTVFLDAPAWTFSVGAGSVTLTVIDAFLGTERFEVFDFGVSLGLTSALPAAGPADCDDDPVICLANPDMSKGFFSLGAGNHSITIRVAEGGFGSAYLRVSEAAAVPAPATLALLLGGLGGLLHARRKSGPTLTGSAA